MKKTSKCRKATSRRFAFFSNSTNCERSAKVNREFYMPGHVLMANDLRIPGIAEILCHEHPADACFEGLSDLDAELDMIWSENNSGKLKGLW